MVRNLVEEIDKKRYNPNVYYTSLDPSARSFRSKNKIGKNITNSQFRSVKRVNYSLADMEAKLYMKKEDENHNDDNLEYKASAKEAMSKFTPQQIIQSKRRFMELDTENAQDLVEIPTLLSAISGMNKDKIDSNTTTISHSNQDSVSRSNRNKIEIPNNILVSYRSTKPPKPKKKNTNRIIALKKVLLSKRSLHTYFDTMNQIERKCILQNVYNKKYFKVLPLITICSICGGCDSLTGCVNCHDKICSLRCFNIHNETRCVNR